jgi:hypothetical protein
MKATEICGIFTSTTRVKEDKSDPILADKAEGKVPPGMSAWTNNSEMFLKEME